MGGLHDEIVFPTQIKADVQSHEITQKSKPHPKLRLFYYVANRCVYLAESDGCASGVSCSLFTIPLARVSQDVSWGGVGLASTDRLPMLVRILLVHLEVSSATGRKATGADLGRILYSRISCQLDAHSSLIAASLAILLFATAPEEFRVPECTTTIKAAGLSEPHCWGITLPNS